MSPLPCCRAWHILQSLRLSPTTRNLDGSNGTSLSLVCFDDAEILNFLPSVACRVLNLLLGLQITSVAIKHFSKTHNLAHQQKLMFAITLSPQFPPHAKATDSLQRNQAVKQMFQRRVCTSTDACSLCVHSLEHRRQRHIK